MSPHSALRAPHPARRLIVNADDFGRSPSINQAVVRAHREGILTTASLMVNEPGFDEAVKLARENPKLGVGLHLTLLMGHSALPPEKIPGLVNARGEFSNSPVGVGMSYFFKRSLREQLRAEIHAQFEKFHATGLPLDHVNGHLHLHLHPVIFKILMEDAGQLGIQRMRLTRDCLARSRRMDARALVLPRFARGDLRMAFPPRPRTAPPARHPARANHLRPAAKCAGGRGIHFETAAGTAARRFRALLASVAGRIQA